MRVFQIVSIILLSIIAIAESKGGGRGNDGGNGGGGNSPPPPKGGSSNKDDDKASGWSNSISTTESTAYTSIPGDDYSVTDVDDDDDYNPNCWYTDTDGKRRKKKKGKKNKWGKWGWKRKHKKKKYKDDDDDDTGYDITSTMDNDYDVTVTATTEYLDIYSTEEEDCDDDDYTKEPWLSATPYTTDDDEDDDNDYTSTISPAVDEDVTTSTTTSSTVITIDCPDDLTEDSPCECFIGVDVDRQCPDRCDISTGECLTPTTTTEEPCPPLGAINDVDTRCECYVVEGADTETQLCPARCDDSTGECLTPQALVNNNDQADGFAFGSSNGNTVGGIAGLIGGIVLISCCLIIIGCIYWKKRNNKYGNVARIDDIEDGRADDIGDDEGILPISTTTMAKSTKTGLDGEEMEMEEIGHATGKTQTIIQYDSSDEDEVALPQKETNGRALDALIVDGNDNYTK